MRNRPIHLLVVALASGACGEAGSVSAPPAGAETPAPADQPDSWCPDPENERVHYQSLDVQVCADVELPCSGAQNGFRSACGCGCIDKGDPICPTLTDGTIDWVGIEPGECDPEPPACALGQFGFSNACGCGCMSPGGA